MAIQPPPPLPFLIYRENAICRRSVVCLKKKNEKSIIREPRVKKVGVTIFEKARFQVFSDDFPTD